jgi:hypothetical protein
MRSSFLRKARGRMMAENIYLFPDTCGPTLREYYSKLLQEPLPQHLRDLLSMLEEAAAEKRGATHQDAEAHEPAAVPHGEPDTPG